MKLSEERLSEVSYRRPSCGGILPDSWFSDKSRSVRCGKELNSSGICPKIAFRLRFRRVGDFHDIIFDGREPKSRL